MHLQRCLSVMVTYVDSTPVEPADPQSCKGLVVFLNVSGTELL